MDVEVHPFDWKDRERSLNFSLLLLTFDHRFQLKRNSLQHKIKGRLLLSSSSFYISFSSLKLIIINAVCLLQGSWVFGEMIIEGMKLFYKKKSVQLHFENVIV